MPSTTLGSRISQTILTSRADSPVCGCHGSPAPIASITCAGDSPAGPTATPVTTATSNTATATVIARPSRARPSVTGTALGVAEAGPAGGPDAGPARRPAAGLVAVTTRRT